MSVVAAPSSVTVNVGRLPRRARGPDLLPGRRPRGSLRPPVPGAPSRADLTVCALTTGAPHGLTKGRLGPVRHPAARQALVPLAAPPRPLGPGLAMCCRRGTSASQRLTLTPTPFSRSPLPRIRPPRRFGPIPDQQPGTPHASVSKESHPAPNGSEDWPRLPAGSADPRVTDREDS